MLNVLLFVAYFLFTCAGMVVIKLGSRATSSVLLHIPVINFSFSLTSLIGFFLYGISFMLYSVLLAKYELSFLNPTTIGITSVLIFISAVVFFSEAITIPKIVALVLILAGVVIINVFK